jgi:tRNA pseudouridine38-40 synthase
MARLRLDLAYDGTAYSGWARQPGLRTVQGVVEQALAQVLRLGEPAAITCAGRTDAGVHARGQVAHVDVPHQPHALDVAALTRSLRGVLPDDVWLTRMRLAPEGFDARFSALTRRYAYRVCDDAEAWDPITRHTTLRYSRPLDLAAMNTAALSLRGEHDFAALCRPREGASTVRTLIALDWSRSADGVAVMSVTADAFCHSMVRALVGVLLPVGDGRKSVAWPGEVLARGVRDSAVQVMPAHALTLEEVTYPVDADLAARQDITRAYRGT